MKYLKIMISNGVVSYPSYYKVKDDEEEELLIQALSLDTEKDGLFIDDVFYVKKSDSRMATRGFK